MAIYNCASTLREALDSIIAQTFTDWELILCNDCSTDETADIAQEYANKYDNILLIHNEKNMRLAASLNHCLRYANGEYIGRMDGDDISLPERFEIEAKFLDSHLDYAFVSCGMINFDENGDWGVQLKPEKPTIRTFAFTSPFCHAPVLMRRKALNEINNYTVRKTLRRGQDYYLWHKFYLKGYKGYNLQKPYYKMRDDQNAAKRRTLKDCWYGTIIQLEVMSNLGLPWYLRIRAFRSIIVGLIPRPIYLWLHKQNIKHSSTN